MSGVAESSSGSKIVCECSVGAVGGRKEKNERASARRGNAARNGGEKGKDGHVLRACSAKDHVRLS